MASHLYPRHLRPRIEEALADTPVVLLNGPRQAGKTTLAGLRRLATLAGRNFRAGVLLYDGIETLPLGSGLSAVPLSTLWLS